MVMAYNPSPGHVRNPMRRVSRNITCFCDSGKKVKKCCGIPLYVEQPWAEKIESHFRMLDDDTKKAIGLRR